VDLICSWTLEGSVCEVQFVQREERAVYDSEDEEGLQRQKEAGQELGTQTRGSEQGVLVREL
jgi:hypothetical protein